MCDNLLGNGAESPLPPCIDGRETRRFKRVNATSPAVVNGPCSESNESALSAQCDGKPRWRRRFAKRQRGISVPTTDSSSCKRTVLERVLFIAVSARTPRLNAPKGCNYVVGSGSFWSVLNEWSVLDKGANSYASCCFMEAEDAPYVLASLTSSIYRRAFARCLCLYVYILVPRPHST